MKKTLFWASSGLIWSKKLRIRLFYQKTLAPSLKHLNDTLTSWKKNRKFLGAVPKKTPDGLADKQRNGKTEGIL